MSVPFRKTFLTPLLGVCLLLAGGDSAQAVHRTKGTFDKRPETVSTVPPRPRAYDDKKSMKPSRTLGPKHYRVPRNVGMQRYHPTPPKRGGGRSTVQMVRGAR